MSSKFGRLKYGAGSYSRDLIRPHGLVQAAPVSLVQAFGQVQINGLVQAASVSLVQAIGRLEWDHIPIESCEGKWAPLVNTPCRRAA